MIIKNQMLLQINDLIQGTIINRPSKIIKSPYVADVIPCNDIEETLVHSAALGCCGLADTNASILMSSMPVPKNKNTKQKCKYRIYLAIYKEKGNEVIIGIHPKLAEDLTEKALTGGFLSKLQNIKLYKRETTIFVEGKVDSRFDFSGIDSEGIPFIMEVKNVPLADYEDIDAKHRKKMNFDNRDFNSKVAYFPDGYRKKRTDPVSPRALKHVRELMLIKKESKTRCIMCFVIQRTDVTSFTASVIDEQYRQAVKEAINAGVEIITMVVKWTREGIAEFIRDDLPVII